MPDCRYCRQRFFTEGKKLIHEGDCPENPNNKERAKLLDELYPNEQKSKMKKEATK